MPSPESHSSRTGFAFAVAAYFAWGIFPVYFRAMKQVPAAEILAHRILWSAVFLSLLVTAGGRWPQLVAALRSWRRFGIYLISTALITSNWLLYIWTVNSGHVLQGSLGYFITPLVNVLLGVLFLGERLRKRQAAAFALAAAGVLILVVRVGTVPWLALGLGLSFGGYGLVRKKGNIDPVIGLLIETLLLAPVAAALIAIRAADRTGWLGVEAKTTVLLLLAGVVTALPLIWFAHGVRRLRLSTMGLIQYISPTMQFLGAVFLFHEPFTRPHAIAFACIWLALGLYTADALTAASPAIEVEPLD